MQSTQHRTNSVVKWYNFVKPNENLLTNWWPFFVRWMLIILVGFIYSYVENCMELCEWIAWNVAMILRTNDKNWFLFDCCTLFYQIFFFWFASIVMKRAPSKFMSLHVYEFNKLHNLLENWTSNDILSDRMSAYHLVRRLNILHIVQCSSNSAGTLHSHPSISALYKWLSKCSIEHFTSLVLDTHIEHSIVSHR